MVCYKVLSRLCITGVQALESNQIKGKSKYVHPVYLEFPFASLDKIPEKK
jgi:hypothetical protein